MYNCIQTNMLEFHPPDFLDQDHNTIEVPWTLSQRSQITDYLYVSNITAISKGDMLFYFLQTWHLSMLQKTL